MTHIHIYGEAIENMPMLEANVHAEYSIPNRLMSYNQNTLALPALEFSGLNSSRTLTFENMTFFQESY